MREDIIAYSRGNGSHKILSKETLNHRELINLASGIDPLVDTKEAYKEAYRVLGIDFINRVPLHTCRTPLAPGESRQFDKTYMISSLGVYDTYYRNRYPYDTVESFLNKKEEELLDYHALRTPVPHTLNLDDIREREHTIGDIGCYYYQLYTTLFMWGIEYLGWMVYMQAIALDPEYVDRYLLQPGFAKTRRLTEILLQTDCPYVFFHDDLATAGGLVCQKSWMEKYLFPRYYELCQIVHDRGKYVIFVCDGNIESILQCIADTGVDGVMLESPATDFSKILEAFADKVVIGGIDTHILSNGTPAAITEHVVRTAKEAEQIAGFVASSCGGLHGGIPIENLEAYFDTRAVLGVNRKDWRFADRE